MSISPIAAGILLLLIVLIGGGVAALLISGREKKVLARVRFATEGFRPAAAPSASALRRAEARYRGEVLLARAAGVFGFEKRRAANSLPPLVILPVALVAAIGFTPVLENLVGGIAYALIPLSWIMLSRAIFGYAKARKLDKLYMQFPDALGTIIRAVRVGIPIAEAIRTVARDSPQPTAQEFSQLADSLTIGMPLEEALRDMASRGGVAEYRFFATALILQAQTGGGLTETLDNLADVIRRRIGLRQRAVALASEARTSALILGVLPVFTGVVLGLINPAYIGALFAPGGRVILAAAIVMLASGALVMRSIIKRSLAL